jgi:hypothetical protein
MTYKEFFDIAKREPAAMALFLWLSLASITIIG